jgi:hypothetical protein
VWRLQVQAWRRGVASASGMGASAAEPAAGLGPAAEAAGGVQAASGAEPAAGLGPAAEAEAGVQAASAAEPSAEPEPAAAPLMCRVAAAPLAAWLAAAPDGGQRVAFWASEGARLGSEHLQLWAPQLRAAVAAVRVPEGGAQPVAARAVARWRRSACAELYLARWLQELGAALKGRAESSLEALLDEVQEDLGLSWQA